MAQAHLKKAIALCLFAWAAWATPSSAASWRTGVPSPSASYFPAIVALKMGFFADEGIPAEYITMKPSIMPAALLNGEIQGTTATGTAASANLKGLPFKIVIFFSTKLMDSLVTKPQIKSVAELRGKIVGVDTFGASTDVITRLVFQKYGLDPARDVKILATGDESIRLEQLKLGQIDAAMLGPQGVVAAKRAGLRSLVDVADEIELPFVGMATTTKIIEQQRGELKKVLRANLRGIRYSIDPKRRDSVVSIMKNWLKLDQETAEYTYGIYLKGASKDGTLNRAGMEALLAERKRQTKVTDEIPLDRVFDFSVVEEINRELGK
ncbi:MAG TPA: ABC transporter substrate-binding protein [Candidatus Binatia bacterium]